MPADRDACELLCAIARYPSGDPTQQIYQLVDKIRDWDSLLSLAQEHRVLPVLFSRFADMGPAVPSPVQDRLQTEYHRNVFHCLANAVELIRVLEAFNHEKIPAMPFKGVVLAASIYHNLTARSAGDLDLLIHYDDLVRATAILQKRGYELKTPVHPDKTPAVPDHYEYHFERQTDGMVLELRWRLELTQPRFRRDLGMDWVWPRRRTAIVAGTEVPDMNSEIKLLVLCMHGSKHIWSRLVWICDVAQLVNASPDLDWQEVIEEAKRSGLWRALALGILLAHRVAGATVPQAALRRFESDTTARRLAQLIQDNLFDAPCSLPTGRMPYNVQLLGFDDRLKMLFSPDFLQPNVRDRAAITLPKSLYALYYLIRPFRILWDRSAR